MDKEKKIEEMARTFCRNSSETPNSPYVSCDKCVSRNLCSCKIYANRLINAGYGNVKQAVKEFAEKLKEIIDPDFDYEGISIQRTITDFFEYLCDEGKL